MVDVMGASVLLVLFLPLLAGIALLIKTVSHGPVLYKQDRIALGGRRFSFLKFRTMQVAANDKCHRQYLEDLICSSETQEGQSRPMRKLDACNLNIIAFGSFLRSSCLDELPQLVNVLRGEMSLVGPRPAIPYEVEAYKPWHSGRFNCMPGMTGLWQISGKNHLSFREMVRLDIRYARSMSFWVDIKILFKTPFAILREILWQKKIALSKAADERD
jgi:lipopolysaccharide/colanic/teichoic acid biosynthesis glycosyltransferase